MQHTFSLRAKSTFFCPTEKSKVIDGKKKSSRNVIDTWSKHIGRRYLSIVDTGMSEATSEGGCQPSFVPTGSFSHMAWTPYSQFVQPFPTPVYTMI